MESELAAFHVKPMCPKGKNRVCGGGRKKILFPLNA